MVDALAHEGVYQYRGNAVHLMLRVNRNEIHLESVVMSLERLEHMHDAEGEESTLCLLERLGKRGHHNAKGNDMSLGILYRADVIEVNERNIVIYHILDNRGGERNGAEEHCLRLVNHLERLEGVVIERLSVGVGDDVISAVVEQVV